MVTAIINHDDDQGDFGDVGGRSIDNDDDNWTNANGGADY